MVTRRFLSPQIAHFQQVMFCSTEILLNFRLTHAMIQAKEIFFHIIQILKNKRSVFMYCRNCGAPLADQCRCLCAMRRYRYLACTAPWHAAALPKPTATLSPPILSVPLWPAALSTAGGSPQRRLSCARLLLPHCWPDPLPCLEGSEAALCACHRQMGADWLYCQYDTHNYWHRIFPFAL